MHMITRYLAEMAPPIAVQRTEHALALDHFLHPAITVAVDSSSTSCA
jgi:hypothetical protein